MDRLKITIDPKPVESLPVKDIKELIPNNLRALKMENLKSIKETIDVLEFAKDLVNIVGDVTAAESAGGSKVSLTEYPAFVPLIFKVPDLVSGIKEVPAELADKITEEEKAQIEAVLKKVNALKNNPDISEAVEDFLNWTIQTKELIMKYIVKK